jgi:hypothetical protein
LKNTHSRKKKLAAELTYFRRRRHRMRYAEAQANALPIGSGAVGPVRASPSSGCDAQGCAGVAAVGRPY